MRVRLALTLSSIVALSGCAYIGPHSDYVADNRYDTYAPKYTEAEKAAMSTESKLDKYNKHVRPQDRMVCRQKKTVGTNFRQTVCTTHQERTDERVAAQSYIRSERQSAVRLGNRSRTYGSLGANPAAGCP